MREMVESCEKLCEAFEEIDDEVLGKLRDIKRCRKRQQWRILDCTIT